VININKLILTVNLGGCGG